MMGGQLCPLFPLTMPLLFVLYRKYREFIMPHDVFASDMPPNTYQHPHMLTNSPQTMESVYADSATDDCDMANNTDVGGTSNDNIVQQQGKCVINVKPHILNAPYTVGASFP